MRQAVRVIYQALVAAYDGFWMMWLAELIWLALSLPVITAPAAAAGMYYTMKQLAYGESLEWKMYFAGVRRYFFASSACAYNTDLQKNPNVLALKESDAYPAMAERGYGWEKLISEMFCQEYWAERGFETHIARFHNVYGPNGTWFGGREKAPAALCRKVIEAKDSGKHEITIWGDGTPTRSFMYIEDCVKGIDMITHCDQLIATPINLGSKELVSVNELVSIIEEIAGVKLERKYDLTAPRGVAGRNSDNTFIEQVLGWEPNITLHAGLAKTYAWIAAQYADRKAGKRVVTEIV